MFSSTENFKINLIENLDTTIFETQYFYCEWKILFSYKNNPFNKNNKTESYWV